MRIARSGVTRDDAAAQMLLLRTSRRASHVVPRRRVRGVRTEITQRKARCDYLPAGDTDKAVWVIPLRKSTSGIQSLASRRGVRGFHTRYIYAGRWRR